MNTAPKANEWLKNQHEPLLSPTQPIFGLYVGAMVNRFGGLIGFEGNAHGNYPGLDFQALKMAVKYKLYAGREIELHAGLALDIYWSDIRFDKQPQRLMYFNYPHDAYLEQINASFSPSITLLHPISRTHPVFKYIYVGAEVGYRQMASYGVWRYGYNADTQDNSYYHSFPIGSFIGNSMMSGVFVNIHVGCSIGAELLAEN
jgi:hypothetical protein